MNIDPYTIQFIRAIGRLRLQPSMEVPSGLVDPETGLPRMPTMADITWTDQRPPPTQEEVNQALMDIAIDDLQTAVTDAVQERLDVFARSRGYDNILSAASYINSKNPKFSAEGSYCVDARDAHWAKCYEIMNEVVAGIRPLPTVEEVLAEMPELVWPV